MHCDPRSPVADLRGCAADTPLGGSRGVFGAAGASGVPGGGFGGRDAFTSGAGGTAAAAGSSGDEPCGVCVTAD